MPRSSLTMPPGWCLAPFSSRCASKAIFSWKTTGHRCPINQVSEGSYMAGNFSSDKKLDIKWASMSLHWNNPTGDDFEPFLEQAKKAGYEGVTCFAFMGLEWLLDKTKVLSQMLRNTGMELAAIDLPLDTRPDDYQRVMDLMEETGCRQMVCIIRVQEK